MLRATAMGGAGIAAAALVGCSDSAEDGGDSSAGAATATGSAAPGTTTPSSQALRLDPGTYQGMAPPTVAEADPLTHGRYGGTLLTRYLDPPHMNFNQTLSCTINTTLDYTKNKLTRAVLGARADPSRIDIEPDLAESWEVVDDGTKFIFKLKPAKFHNVEPTNGREMTSADVKASFERYKSGGTQKDMFAEVSSFETPDDRTLVVNLSEPVFDFPRNIAAWSHIDAQEVLDDEEFLKEHAVGTGPFVQQEWTPKERSVFVRHPDYFEDGLPFLDQIVTRVIEDNAVLRAGFQTDNLFDWGARDEADGQEMLSSVDDAVMMTYERGQGANSNSFRFQMSNQVLQDERVRRGISMSINREEYSIAKSYEGGGFPYPAIAWQFLYDDRPSLADMGPWFQPNPEEASKMLQAAGYTEDAPLSFEITGWYLSRSYSFEDLVLPMMNALPELNLSYRQVDNPTSVTMLNDRAFEWAHGMTYGPPAYSVDQIVFPFFHSKGGVNFSNINDSELDGYIEAQRREPDEAARKELAQKIWTRDLDQVYDVYLPYNAVSYGVWHNYMLNYRPHGIGGYTCYGNGQARAVWLDEGAPQPTA